VSKPIPTAKGIATLFDGSSPLRTPIIQRSYAWTPENVKDYWKDLSEARAAGRYHFLGLIVIDNDGRIHDGQQRLATTFLFIQALKAQLEQCVATLSARQAEDANVDGLRAGLTTALKGDKKVPTAPLSIGKGDQSFLLDPATGVTASTESQTRLQKARGTLIANLARELDSLPDDTQRIEALWNWWDFLGEQASVMELIVTSQTASSIFETLNTRGVHLSNGDLVKSYLLATLDEADQVEGMTTWEQITVTLGKETALNEFLLHFWGSHHGHITRAGLFPALKERVNGNSPAAKRQLQSYQKDSLLYAALRNAADTFWNPFGEETIDAIKLINALGLTQLRYLLLAVLRELPKGQTNAKKRRKEQAAAIQWLGAWSLRGVVAGRTGVKAAETAFINTATAVREGNAKTAAAIKQLFVKEGRAVGDPEFEAELSRASLNATATRMVIYALESKLLGVDSPLGPKPKLTREHVLPQSPDWDEPDWDHFTEQDHLQYVERLGNTLLLTGVTNRELKNKSWAEKRHIIRSKGVKQLPLTEEALEETEWTKQTIEKRQNKMAKLALDVWPE
jgi:hypothetical protein